MTLVGHQDRINCLAILPDGRIVSGSCDCTLKIWDPVTVRQSLSNAVSNCHATFEAHTQGITYVTRIVSGSIVNLISMISILPTCVRI